MMFYSNRVLVVVFASHNNWDTGLIFSRFFCHTSSISQSARFPPSHVHLRVQGLGCLGTAPSGVQGARKGAPYILHVLCTSMINAGRMCLLLSRYLSLFPGI